MDFTKNIKLLIFDFDGTLHDLVIDWEEMRRAAGISDTKESLGDAIERLNREGDDRTLISLSEIEEAALGKDKLDDEVVSTLKELSEKYKLAILTRNSGKVVADFLGRHLQVPFYILGREGVKRLKPDPSGIYEIMRHFDVVNNQTILIGDTSHDVLAAKNAEVECILVGSNYGASTDSIHIAAIPELRSLL